MVFLDFEKPISDLYLQKEKLENIGKKSTLNVDDSILELDKKIEETRIKIYSNLSRWQKVQVARHPERPYTLHYIELLSDNFIELHGDRKFKDDKAIIGGFCKIDGKAIMVIGHQKGRNTKMRQYRNFGMAQPEGYRKALRLMKLAEKFNVPIITFIDTPGAYPGLEAEQRGQAEAIARNLYEMAKLEVPILSFVIGEGASGGALGIGVSDKLFMLEHAWFSVISPESCSSILWRTWEQREIAAEALKLTAQDNFEFGIIDAIIPEPIGGAHTNHEEMAKIIKPFILKELEKLEQLSVKERIKKRIEKLEKIGSVG
ncbi:MAG: acetyl-CoA carboxylase carboxyltransferase subunit alpha [Bacteroidetes bacterium]|jgi:acetyl-CoA carboxylase carboxyl transferase subunit alpha|nr:acetyl-CoA carboxylase carboxyltransferase subunit alpha [Bacteroidota bacterium]MBK8674412.1 acetyl-CoA carboxylase carboxyltransferase subunit alpha [Bacteroidota bacterium]MBK9355465.1 acetyl-CoA carboxylase carboxyltransferase subunit alpha [Bacteroidota bacterium]MBL0287644.1 acetyl-CoA carboxylase carboxyltransferase subunit alpha [Bacteroidota bacterium]MBP9136024.1 acetyl-CoA carboxylase carboxyltransferase subunit alpha [Chitinophagales bacterium]